MKGLGAAILAIVMAVKDVLTPRLFFMALLCFAAVLALAVGAAWAAGQFLPPLIPDGKGVLHYFTAALDFALGPGAFFLVLLLAPAIALFVGGLMFDAAAEKVERAIGAPKARAIPLSEGLWNGVRVGVESFVVNLIVLPALIVPPIFPVVFLIVNGYLFGLGFFMAAAVRHMSYDEARAQRRSARLSVFLIGMACSVIPFIAPLIGASAMARLVKALMGPSSNSDSGTPS